MSNSINTKESNTIIDIITEYIKSLVEIGNIDIDITNLNSTCYDEISDQLINIIKTVFQDALTIAQSNFRVLISTEDINHSWYLLTSKYMQTISSAGFDDDSTDENDKLMYKEALSDVDIDCIAENISSDLISNSSNSSLNNGSDLTEDSADEVDEDTSVIEFPLRTNEGGDIFGLVLSQIIHELSISVEFQKGAFHALKSLVEDHAILSLQNKMESSFIRAGYKPLHYVIKDNMKTHNIQNLIIKEQTQQELLVSQLQDLIQLIKYQGNLSILKKSEEISNFNSVNENTILNLQHELQQKQLELIALRKRELLFKEQLRNLFNIFSLDDQNLLNSIINQDEEKVFKPKKRKLENSANLISPLANNTTKL